MIKNAHLRNFSYYQTGGRCKALFQPSSESELCDALHFTKKHKFPLMILGGGTNSLILDQDWPGVVLSLSSMLGLKWIDERRLWCQAGVTNTQVAILAEQKSLTGAEFLYRLPGQLGGTVRMNARCFGGEISQIVRSVTSYDSDAHKRIYSDSSIFRGYKDTVFMDNKEIITNVELQFGDGVASAIRNKMLANEHDRLSKGHFDLPSCGCVFKNNYEIGVPAGKLLDAAGAKKLTMGKAIVNQKHANFVFNSGGATSHDILVLTFLMQDLVYEKFGVWLEYEMEVLGELETSLKLRMMLKKQQVPKPDEISSLKNPL